MIGLKQKNNRHCLGALDEKTYFLKFLIEPCQHSAYYLLLYISKFFISGNYWKRRYLKTVQFTKIEYIQML